VYERAVAAMFGWPHCYEIWVTYLEKVIEKYADKKCERIREMFEQVLKTVPQEVSYYSSYNKYL
jgi:pre-mRNA-splicing factor SYF1